MTPNRRFYSTVVVLVALLTTVGFAATEGYLPKYAADGSLIDSAIYETGGDVGIGTTAPFMWSVPSTLAPHSSRLEAAQRCASRTREILE